MEDRHVTATPEGVTVELVLAGLGSRAVAFIVDMLIVVPAALLAIGLVSIGSGGSTRTSVLVRTAATALSIVVIYFGYFIACDMAFSGRSIGKRAAGLRVIRTSGAPVGLWASLVRNLLRIIDGFPGSIYLVGAILVLTTSRNQRLGDLASDTIVVRTRRGADREVAGTPWTTTAQWSGMPVPWGAPPPGGAAAYPGPGAVGWLPPELAYWDVSGVNEQDLTIARLFLANRFGYTPDARQRLGARVAGQLWPSVAGAPGNLHPEQFIECVVLVKSARG